MVAIFFDIDKQYAVPVKELQEQLQYSVAKSTHTADINIYADINITYKHIIMTKDYDNVRICCPGINDFIFALGKLITICDRHIFRENYVPICSQLGLMTDCSRNAVLNVDTVKFIIRQLALTGYTYLQLYTEDTYEIKDYPYFGHMRGRYTVEELQDIDAYGALYGIEVIPCIQTLAHLQTIFRWNAHWEMHDIYNVLLLRNEKTYELIENMVKTMRTALKSNKINIGMDEAHLLGRGRFMDENGYIKGLILIEEHLQKVYAICKKYNFSPSIWSDMPFKLAYGKYDPSGDMRPKKLLPDVQDNIELIFFNYDLKKESYYDKMFECHKKITNKTAYACGAWSWTGFTPHNNLSIEYLKNSVKSCYKNKIDNIMLTQWGDDGAECPLVSVLPVVYTLGEMRYNNAEAEGDDKRFSLLYGYNLEELKKLDLPNKMSETYQLINPSKYCLYNDILLGLMDKHIGKDASEYFSRSYEELMHLAQRNSIFSCLFKTLARLCKVLITKADAGIKLKALYDNNDREGLKLFVEETLTVLTEDMFNFYIAMREQWMLYNKPFGFENLDIRLGSVMQRIRATSVTITEYLNNKINCIEELECQRLPYNKDLKNDEYMLFYSWIFTAAAGIIYTGM